MPTPADEEMIGRHVAGKFLVETFLGGGAMGAVYKAYQKSIEKHVAIKVLHRQFVTDSNFVSRFEREAKAASLLDHANLMRVIDYGREPDGVCYIAMELLAGRSLFQLMKDEGRLDNERIAGIIRQTLAGLAVAHEQGIIHRDLKPENIVILERKDDDGKKVELVKVCDFGMAKMVTPEVDVNGPMSSEKLTSHGVVVGTPDYMSPEQGKGERLDARSDLYAVGIMLYQMLTGRLPFTAETPIATLLRHVVEEPVRPSEIDPGVHPGLEAVCLRALSKQREDRFQSAREMRTEIRAVMEGHSTSMPSVLPAPRAQLGSMGEDELAAFDLRAPGVPRSLDLPPPRQPMHTPPASHRIKALEALDEQSRPKRSIAPIVLGVILAVGAAGGFVAMRHRHTRALAVAAVPPPVASPADTAMNGSPAAPPTGAPTLPPGPAPMPAVAADPRVLAPNTYTTPPPATLAVRGAKPEGSTSAVLPSGAAPVPGGPAFGVLAVPEVPKIAGASGPLPQPVAPPAPAQAASAPAAAPEPFDHAKVIFGQVRGEHVAAADVVAALPGGSFDGCYKGDLRKRKSVIAGQGVLHLVLDDVGHIGGASFAGAPDLAGVGQCIADASLGRNVKHVESGVTGADVSLTFKAE